MQFRELCSWPLTFIMQKRDHFRLLRHHYSESPVIPLSNDIWYRCVAHGFITFDFLIFYRWSKRNELIKLYTIYTSTSTSTRMRPPSIRWLFCHFFGCACKKKKTKNNYELNTEFEFLKCLIRGRSYNPTVR